MNLFELILSPFIFIIEQLFLVTYKLTENYGIAIILLSFAISLLLLPIFILIEKAKKKDDAVKLKMKPLIDEIKRCYKGQERYYYLKTLNRQYNYSPVRALIPILSLLLQIPFFIAAYQFLEQYEPLAGISFGFITDLSAPDALFGKINILPIAMTIVNLLTAFFYTRNGNTGERKQMLIVAGIFLILLFNLPAGLVLYWTMNNVFSFFRLFITNAEVFKKKKNLESNIYFTFSEYKLTLQPLLPKLKRTFIVITTLGILSQLNWAFQHSFENIIFRLSIAFGISLIFTLSLAIIAIIYKVDVILKRDNIKYAITKLWPVFKYTFILIASILVLSQINWALNHHFNDFVERLFFSVLASLLFTYLISFVVLAYQGRVHIFENKVYKSISSFGKGYSISFWLLSSAIIISQLNWAMHHYFDDIILRLSFVMLFSWILVLFAAHSIFSLSNRKITIKSIIPFLIERTKPLKWVYLILTSSIIISQVNWALKHSFDDFAVRLLGAIAGSTMLILITALLIPIYKKVTTFWLGVNIHKKTYLLLYSMSLFFYLAASYYFSGINIELDIFSGILIIPTQLIALNIFVNQKDKLPSITYNIISFLLTCIALFQILNLYAFISEIEISFSILNTAFTIKKSILHDVIYNGIIFSFVPTLLLLRTEEAKSSTKLINKHWVIFILTITYLVGLIFLWYPLIVFSSSPESFSFSALSIVNTNLKYFLITTISLITFYSILPKKIKQILLIGFLSIGIITFFNVFISPIDMGTLQMGRFSNINNLNFSNSVFIFESAFLLMILWISNYIIKKQYSNQLIVFLILLNIIPFAQSIYLAIIPDHFANKEFSQNANIGKKEENISFSTKTSISFSKENENVVIIMADMFQGWYIKNIMQDDTILKASFNGFVWYSNTIAVTNYTIGSMPTILAGYDFTPDILDKDSTKSLGEKNIRANEIFRDKIKENGFHFTSTKVPYSKMDKKTIDTYLPMWHTDWDYLKNHLSIGNARELSYTILWQNALFFAAPNFIKPKIYNNGSWLLSKKDLDGNAKLAEHYNFVRTLPYISDAQNKKPNFTLICTKASHFPWDIVDNNGNLQQNVTPYENNKWTLEKIAAWILWMKKEGVYNNTKIIIVSDHGIRDTEVNETIMIDNPFIPQRSEKVSLKELLYYTPLLMVKDFESTNTFQEDKRFMSIADVPSIAFDENNQTKADPNIERTLKAYMIYRIRPRENHFNIKKTYTIKDNVYEIDNWTVVDSD